MPIPIPDPNDERTIFRQAADTGDHKTVSELIEKGINVNAANDHDDTALHLASFYGHKDIVVSLIKARADLNLSNKNGQTPLQLAACRGHLDVVKELTQAGCDLNINTNFSEFTALHFASKNGQNQICQYLLDSGADEYVEDLIGQHAESYALNNVTEEVFRKQKQKSGGKGNKAANTDNKQVPKSEPVTAAKTSTNQNKDDKGSQNKTPANSNQGQGQTSVINQSKKDEDNAKTTKPKAQTANGNQEQGQTSAANQSNNNKDNAKTTKPKAQAANGNQERGKTSAANQSNNDKDDAKTTKPKAQAANGNQDQSQTSATNQSKNDKDNAKTIKPKAQAGKDGASSSGGISQEEAKNKWKYLTKSETNKIQDHGKFQGDDSKKKFVFQKKEQEVGKVQNHKFEYSEEYKARMKMSVYDRLMGKK